MIQIPLRNREREIIAYTIIDDEDAHLAKLTWSMMKNGYAARSRYGTAIYLHRAVTNAPKDKIVDHINQNKLDNRRANLRLCTNSENLRNMRPRAKNTSGHPGVSWDKANSQWRVSYYPVGGRAANGGRFDRKEDAIARAKELRRANGYLSGI